MIRMSSLNKKGMKMVKERLRIIPFYTRVETLDRALKSRESLNLLWLEILFNDHISWEDYLDVPEIRMAYDKACLWYSNFKTLLDCTVKRRPLRKAEGKIDDREYRRFMEVLNFVAN